MSRNLTVVIRGDKSPNVRNRLTERLSQLPRITLESQQQEEQAKQDALLSLFVVKPKQTGYTALAELRQAAMQDPACTAVLVSDPVGMGALEGDKELDNALDELLDMGVGVFDDEDDVVDFINNASEQSGDYTAGIG